MPNSRVSSVASSAVSKENEIQRIESIINTTRHCKLSRTVKLNLILLVPTCTILVLMGILLEMSHSATRDATQTKEDVKFVINVATLVNMLQIERGTTAMYMSSKTNVSEIARVQFVRQQTDNASREVPPNLAVTLSFNFSNPKEQTVAEVPKALREDVNKNILSLREMIFRYTTLNHRLLDMSMSQVGSSMKELPWRTLVSIDAMSRASDSVGIQRALGSTFFVTCGFDKETELWFRELETELQTYMQLSFYYNPDSYSLYLQALNETDNVMDKIYFMKSIIERNDNNYQMQCSNWTEEERLANGSYWFATLTVFIEILRDVRVVSGSNIQDILEKHVEKSTKNVALYTAISFVIIIVSLFLGAIYSKNINNMTSEMKDYSDKVRGIIKLNNILLAIIAKCFLAIREMASPAHCCSFCE